MEIKVQFFAFFREYGKSELALTLPEESTISDLLPLLTAQLGDRFGREVGCKVAENRDLQALVFVRGESICNLKQLDTPLKAGDIVKFLPPMAGG